MRSAPWIATLAALVMMSPSVFAAGKGDPAKGKQIVDQVCAACHGVDGNSVASANPNLAGQHPEYIVKQLNEFKSQVRKNPVMLGMASPLSAADMQNVAAYYSSQAPKAKGASDKALIEAGKKIYRGGIAAKAVPACMACHSPNGAGIPAQYPRMAGQHGAYTEAQLKAFRSGERGNNPVMSQVAARLSDQEIKAVAEYIQALN
ncbi:cytochrome c [Chitiniphilus shinanonensis]|uniref:Cytochrome c n=1 Tax=Chitiniphilus shinanonensis TaxID=553088 RepID=A0ABQ6BTF6_9NEIS|nr:cytochrome c [Chitiniphilus shinanonensis]GLS04722.1 cytochrome c [Chitiniphilus shinanonensis]